MNNSQNESRQKKKLSRKKKNQIIVILLVSASFLSLVAAACGFGLYTKEKKKNPGVKSELEALTADYELLKNELDGVREKLDAEEKEKEELKKTVEMLSGNNAAAELKDKLDKAEKELEETRKKAEELETMLDKLSSSCGVDLNKQHEIIGKLNEYIEKNTPSHKVTETDEDGNVTEKSLIAHISVYYENIENGFSYSYNPDETFESASCMKAPFALSILRDEANKKKLDEVFTYTESAYDEGSGVIKKMPFGKEFTNYELVSYMIKESDCVAYKHLIKTFGSKQIVSLASEIGAESVKRDVGTAKTPDAGKVMKAIYEYIESDEAYAGDFKAWLINSAYPAMIPAALKDKTVAHKYGWDDGSYNDWAIVYDEHPYVLIFMSDCDTGGGYLNNYIGEISRMIDEMHQNFYN